MKRILFIFAICILAINGCKKDPVAPFNNITINDNVVQVGTTAIISGTIECPIAITRIELYIDAAEDMPDPTKYDAEIIDKYFELNISNLNSGTTYYYKYKVYTSEDEMELDVRRIIPHINSYVNIVTFGTQSWYVGYSEAHSAYREVKIEARAAQEQEYPKISMDLNISSTGVYTDEINSGSLGYNNEIISLMDYYDSITWSVGDGFRGDWWAESATINVTTLDLTAMEIGMYINATMFELISITVEEDGAYLIKPDLLPSANKRTMTVQLFLPMTEASKATQQPLNKKIAKGSKVVEGRK